jgi:hypothetical protein
MNSRRYSRRYKEIRYWYFMLTGDLLEWRWEQISHRNKLYEYTDMCDKTLIDLDN